MQYTSFGFRPEFGSVGYLDVLHEGQEGSVLIPFDQQKGGRYLVRLNFFRRQELVRTHDFRVLAFSIGVGRGRTIQRTVYGGNERVAVFFSAPHATAIDYPPPAQGVYDSIDVLNAYVVNYDLDTRTPSYELPSLWVVDGSDAYDVVRVLKDDTQKCLNTRHREFRLYRRWTDQGVGYSIKSDVATTRYSWLGVPWESNGAYKIDFQISQQYPVRGRHLRR